MTLSLSRVGDPCIQIYLHIKGLGLCGVPCENLLPPCWLCFLLGSWQWRKLSSTQMSSETLAFSPAPSLCPFGFLLLLFLYVALGRVLGVSGLGLVSLKSGCTHGRSGEPCSPVLLPGLRGSETHVLHHCTAAPCTPRVQGCLPARFCAPVTFLPSREPEVCRPLLTLPFLQQAYWASRTMGT